MPSSLEIALQEYSKISKIKIIEKNDHGILVKEFTGTTLWGSFHWLEIKENKLKVYTYNNFLNYSWTNHIRFCRVLEECFLQ